MTKWWISAAAAGAVAALGLSIAAYASDRPHRKPGHWQMTMTMPMGAGTRTVDTCVRANDDFASPAESQNKGKCSAAQITKTATGISSTVVCNMNGMKQTVTSTFSGDFDSAYHGTVKMTMEPTMAGMGSMEMTVDAKYIGPDCPKSAIAVPH